jgi:beta-lactamase superfamily II metal-dependent hydrolase
MSSTGNPAGEIDGGRTGTYAHIKPLLQRLRNSELDLLVATHVDRDHILGVLAMLDEPSFAVHVQGRSTATPS